MSKETKMLETIKETFEDFCKDAELLLIKGNKSAGRRSRTISSKLDKLNKEWRKATLELEKSI